MDYAEHKIEVAVHNDSEVDFTVLALTFGSAAFDPQATYERAPSTITPGSTTNLRLVLPKPRCDVDPGKLKVTVSFEHDGRLGTASTSPQDRLNQLPELIASDCRESAMLKVANISVADHLGTQTLNGEKVGVIEITFTPTGAGGKLVLEDVRGTVLLSLRNANGPVELDTIQLGMDIGAATSPVIYDLLVVPARCDPHAVAEDKVGTLFRFHVVTDRDTGLFTLAVSDQVRGELYRFVSDWCGNQ